MASFRSDKIVFGVGFTATLLLFAATLHSAVKEADKEVNCWVPAQFSGAHVEYTNHICEYEENRHVGSLNDSDRQPDSGTNKQTRISACSLAYYGAQAVFLFISYYILSSITSTFSKIKCSDDKSSVSKESLVPEVGHMERTSCTIMVSYLFTQLLTSAILIGLGMRSLAEFPPLQQGLDKNHTFICTFDIKNFRQIVRYTVQCVEDEEDFGGPIALLMRGAPYMNAMLCVVLVVMIAVHVATMLCCGSRARGLPVRGLEEKHVLEYEVNHPNGCISDATLEAALARENCK